MSGIAIQNGGVVVDGNGGLCLGCCDYAGAGNDCCCFLEPETEGACGNADWNAFSPFGGPGKTPAFYSATVQLTFPSTATLSWHSDSIPWEGLCAWYGGSASGGHFTLGPDSLHGNCEPSNPEEWYVNWYKNTGGACNESFGSQIGDIAAYISAIPCLGAGELNDCPLSGTLNVSHGDHAGVCIRRLVSTSPWVYEEGTGVISWHPGSVPEWDECTDYEIGDMVAHEGVFYVCTQAHAAGTPPTCTGSKEPPNASYWDVA